MTKTDTAAARASRGHRPGPNRPARARAAAALFAAAILAALFLATAAATPCQYDDGSGGHCWWNASEQGNHQGQDFIVLGPESWNLIISF